MWWQQFVGSLDCQVSFAKESYFPWAFWLKESRQFREPVNDSKSLPIPCTHNLEDVQYMVEMSRRTGLFCKRDLAIEGAYQSRLIPCTRNLGYAISSRDVDPNMTNTWGSVLWIGGWIFLFILIAQTQWCCIKILIPYITRRVGQKWLYWISNYKSFMFERIQISVRESLCGSKLTHLERMSWLITHTDIT